MDKNKGKQQGKATPKKGAKGSQPTLQNPQLFREDTANENRQRSQEKTEDCNDGILPSDHQSYQSENHQQKKKPGLGESESLVVDEEGLNDAK
jgi:hypothetical protein